MGSSVGLCELSIAATDVPLTGSEGDGSDAGTLFDPKYHNLGT